MLESLPFRGQGRYQAPKLLKITAENLTSSLIFVMRVAIFEHLAPDVTEVDEAPTGNNIDIRGDDRKDQLSRIAQGLDNRLRKNAVNGRVLSGDIGRGKTKGGCS